MLCCEGGSGGGEVEGVREAGQNRQRTDAFRITFGRRGTSSGMFAAFGGRKGVGVGLWVGARVGGGVDEPLSFGRRWTCCLRWPR